MKPVYLRVGICSCSSKYHGRLQGAVVELEKRQFRIQEVYIFEKNPREGLKGTRCHFFLDTHYRQGYCEINIIQITFVSNGQGRGWKMFIGGCGHTLGSSLRRGWTRKRPPTTHEVLTGVQSLLAVMPVAKLEKWLANANPCQ